jgi:hypothetical protein
MDAAFGCFLVFLVNSEQYDEGLPDFQQRDLCELGFHLLENCNNQNLQKNIGLGISSSRVGQFLKRLDYICCGSLIRRCETPFFPHSHFLIFQIRLH